MAHGVVEGEAQDLDEEVDRVAGQVALGPAPITVFDDETGEGCSYRSFQTAIWENFVRGVEIALAEAAEGIKHYNRQEQHRFGRRKWPAQACNSCEQPT